MSNIKKYIEKSNFINIHSKYLYNIWKLHNKVLTLLFNETIRDIYNHFDNNIYI